jgi:DNA-binding NarL/FixJ family response regulator
MLRLVVADENRLIAAGIRNALQDEPEIEIVGEAYSGDDVLPLVARTLPDVVLLDLRMPSGDGLDLLDVLRQRHPDVKVVMLSTYSDWEHIQTALSHGASGYIVKTINPRDLASALRQAVERSVYHAVAGGPPPRERRAREVKLTDRELTILRGVARGLSNQAIARELWVTEQTVKFHLTNVYRKLGVSNRTEAARYAYVHHVVEPDDDELE